MSSNNSSEKVQNNKFPPLFYASLGALVALLITAYVLIERSSQKNAELINEFGATVTSLTSRELVDSAVSEDLVSMQAILQSLTAQPRVAMARVRNLDQQLVVQSGEKQSGMGWKEYSAPITAGDSVQGYVTVTLTTGFPGDDAVLWTLIGTSSLLVLMVLLTLYESRGRAWGVKDDNKEEFDDWQEDSFGKVDPTWADRYSDDDDPQATAELNDDDDITEPRWLQEQREREAAEAAALAEGGEQTPAALDEPKEDPEHDSAFNQLIETCLTEDGSTLDKNEANSELEELTDSPLADNSAESTKPTSDQPITTDLIVVLANYPRLEKQINGERFRSLVSDFERTLSEVLGLYGGKQLGEPHNQNVYCIRFTSTESVSEAAFRAACSAYLVDKLNQQNSVRFNIVADICHPDEDVKLAVNKLGVFMHKALWGDLLDRRLLVKLEDDGRYHLDGFKAPFSSLLERQQAQLLAPA